MKKRVVCAFLGLVMMVSQSFMVFAETEESSGRESVKSDK